jgi:hypothetical protein
MRSTRRIGRRRREKAGHRRSKPLFFVSRHDLHIEFRMRFVCAAAFLARRHHLLPWFASWQGLLSSCLGCQDGALSRSVVTFSVTLVFVHYLDGRRI